MPIYEFLCPACAAQFETFVLKRDEQVACPRCGEKRLTKLMSSPGKPGCSNNAQACGPTKGFS